MVFVQSPHPFKLSRTGFQMNYLPILKRTYYADFQVEKCILCLYFWIKLLQTIVVPFQTPLDPTILSTYLEPHSFYPLFSWHLLITSNGGGAFILYSTHLNCNVQVHVW